MPPTRAIIRTMLTCVMAITTAAPGTPASAAGPTAAVSATATAAADGTPPCGTDAPYPIQQADAEPPDAKPTGASVGLVDGLGPATALAPRLDRLTGLRARSQLPDSPTGAVDTRPA